MHDNQDINFEKNDSENNDTYRYDVMSTDARHTSYTLPNGGAGYIYTPGVSPQRPMRRKKGVLVGIVTLAVLLLIFLMSTVFVGGMLFGFRLDYLGGKMDEDLSGNPAIGQMQYDRNAQPSASSSKLNKATSQNLSGMTSAGENAMSVPEVVSRVSASVVEITTETAIGGTWVSSYVSDGAGSGVVISEDGYIVTNYHVVEDADSIRVRLTDGTEFEAHLLASDGRNDLALLWIDAGEHPLTVAQMGCSSDLVVGERVLAIGNPLGALGGTVTDGIISATARTLEINGNTMTLLQTNAAVNPGNSGGGLFNLAGQLVGVVNAKCSDDDVEGLGFAIPVDTVYESVTQMIDITGTFVKDLREYGYVRGIVDSGLSLYDVTSMQAAFYYFNASSVGVYVLQSDYSQEIEYGDRIVSVNGIAVNTAAEVSALLADCQVGDTLALVVRRGGRNYEVTLTLREYVPEQFSENISFE